MVFPDSEAALDPDMFLFDEQSIPHMSLLTASESLDWLGGDESLAQELADFPSELHDLQAFEGLAPDSFSVKEEGDAGDLPILDILDECWLGQGDDMMSSASYSQDNTTRTPSPASSDTDDALRVGTTTSSMPMLRKSSSSYDDEFKAKKGKGVVKGPSHVGSKGAVVKGVGKPGRRVQDDVTLKAISQLRAEAADHPESKRRIHNVLERQRRNDLKFCYQALRNSIGDMDPSSSSCSLSSSSSPSSSDRTPTGTILAQAATYIKALQDHERQLEADFTAAIKENTLLRARLGLK